MIESAVNMQHLKFNYGRLKVIDDISLDIPKGISFGLLGSNGAGKTTLIRLMVGLLKPSGGNILCLGKRPAPSTARNIGYMPQLPSLYNELSVRQNVDFFARCCYRNFYRLRISNLRLKFPFQIEFCPNFACIRRFYCPD